jgi:hypothetical protein
MITADRFLAAKYISESEWMRARRAGVTATAVAEVAAKRDRAAAITEWMNPTPFEANDFMIFGSESEAAMMQYAHQQYGILPVDWVIAGEDRLHRATPDGLSPSHEHIAECKAPGDPWEGAETNQKKIPIRYRRQVQWQLHVTGADTCLFLWNQRVPEGTWFRLAWFAPRHVWIRRDEAMISDLIEVAGEMLEARDGRREAA